MLGSVESKAMQYLVATPITKHNLMRVTALSWEGRTDWQEIGDFFRKQIHKGVLNWELDLRQLSTLDSLAYGMILSLKMMVSYFSGTFRLLVEPQTSVMQHLEMNKLHVLVPVINRSWD